MSTQSMMLPTSLAKLVTGRRAEPWPILDTSSYRPGFALRPERIWHVFRHAEQGQPLAQCDLFEDLLENDGHLRGQYWSRLMSIAFRPWIMQAGAKDPLSIEAAQALGRALKRTNMMALLWHLMDSLGYGYSCANIVWEMFEDLVAPRWFICAPHRRFMLPPLSDRLTFRTIDNPFPGEELAPGEWIVAARPHRKVVRGGAFRTTAWWTCFKRMSIADWIVFAEKFGIPAVLGYYQERASPESRRALEKAIEDIGTDGQAILSDLTKIVVENIAIRQGDVGALHPAIADRCDAEISKVITGATLNVEGGHGPGSFALGKVHEQRATSIVYGDAFWIQDVFHAGVVMPFLEYNPQFAKAEPPKLSIRVQPEMDPLTLSKVLVSLQQMGLQLDPDQLYALFGLQRPDDGDGLVPYVAPASAGPSGAEPGQSGPE